MLQLKTVTEIASQSLIANPIVVSIDGLKVS